MYVDLATRLDNDILSTSCALLTVAVAYEPDPAPCLIRISGAEV